jgi:hypothetical protein
MLTRWIPYCSVTACERVRSFFEANAVAEMGDEMIGLFRAGRRSRAQFRPLGRIEQGKPPVTWVPRQSAKNRATR